MKFYYSFIKFITLCLLPIICLACSQDKNPEGEAAQPPKLFKVHGIIQEIKPEDMRIIIDHEEIPGYMGAMIMPFNVKKSTSLSGLAPGDGIHFDYRVEELQSWIENISLTGNKGAIKAPGDGGPVEASNNGLAINSQLPDYHFIDENGTPVKLSDYRGGPVALTFVFTRCPVPEYCPAMMRKFSKVTKTLEAAPDAPASWTLLTISFDVDYDTPEIMRTWGKIFGFKSGHSWHLLSSEKDSDTIKKISADVDLKFGENKGSYQHNLRTVILDATGKIRHVFTDETWSSDDLIAKMKDAAAPPK